MMMMMMAVPKKKPIKSQTKTRFSAYVTEKNIKSTNLAKFNINKCEHCSQLKRMHFVCSNDKCKPKQCNNNKI